MMNSIDKETHIRLKCNITKLPFDIFSNKNIYIHYSLDEEIDIDYNENLNAKIIMLINKYLYKDRIILDSDYKCEYSIYSSRAVESGPIYKKIKKECKELDEDQKIISLEPMLGFEDDIIPFLSLLKRGHVYMIARDIDRGYRHLGFIVFKKYSKELMITKNIRYQRLESGFNYDEYIRDNSIVVPLKKAKSAQSLEELFSPHSMLSTEKTLRMESLENIATFSYGYAESYSSKDDDGPLSFVASRSEIDEYGGIYSISDESKWKPVSSKKYKASLLKDKDIYITRKSSAVRIGIFNKSALYSYAPKKIQEKEDFKVYLFASPIIIRVNEDIPPYFVMACLFHMRKSFVSMGKNNFFTTKAIDNIKIPILNNAEMKQIADEFETQYRGYLYEINEKVERVIKPNNIVSFFN